MFENIHYNISKGNLYTRAVLKVRRISLLVELIDRRTMSTYRRTTLEDATLFDVRSNQLVHTCAHMTLSMPPISLMNSRTAASRLSDRVTRSCFLVCGKRKKSHGREIWRIRAMGHQLHTLRSQHVSHCRGSVR